MTRVSVPPEMLLWACERAGYDVAHLAVHIPQLPAWVRRERQPTLKQLERLAKATHTPLGYLFLPEPPDERLPVPDYRTVASAARDRPSPDLLDTLYTMRRRQEWLRESLVENDAEPLAFVGSARLPLAAVVAPRLPRYSPSESVLATRSRPRWRYDRTARGPDSIPIYLLGRSVIPLEIALEQGGHV